MTLPESEIRKPRLPILLLAGFAIGGLAAFLGIGGGVALVPTLMFAFGLEQRRAVGTSLGIILFVVGAGIVTDVIVGTTATRPALLAVLCIVPTAMLASRTVTPWIQKIPTIVLRRGFAVVLLIAALKMFELPPFDTVGGAGLFRYAELDAGVVTILVVLGLLVGTVSALVGIGGGILVIPTMAFLFSDLTWLQCRGTSLLVVAPTAFIGYHRHLRQGTADPRFVRPIAPACVVGSVVGSLLAHGADATLFQRIFGACLLIVGVRLALTRPS